MSEERISKPPSTCDRLYEYFTADGLCLQSLHGALIAMTSTGIGVRGQPDPDGRMVRSGSVGFKQRDQDTLAGRLNDDGARSERPSKAQRYAETAKVIALLTAEQVRVLQLAYGPQDAIPELKLELAGSAQARASLEGPGQERARKQRAAELGNWAQVMVETEAARAGLSEWLAIKRAALAKQSDAIEPGANLVEWAMAHMDSEMGHLKSARQDVVVSVSTWLVHHASKIQKSACRVEAHKQVTEAWNAWMAARKALGMVRSGPRLHRGFVYHRGEES